MSYQVLARKWRPQTFDEVIGQDHIVRSLINQIQISSLGHAFLFSGTRGVGKTSMARILAKAIRCPKLIEGYNPCNNCACCLDTTSDSSMDVIEIDGASNNSVDNIREIIESSKFLPVSGSKRVFIIDEVHMLSSSAFNALLKTLEEPPDHVVFIFATTEPEKLPATVLSRCQKYDFLEVSIDILVAQIKKIGKSESIEFESDQVVRKICQHGDGSVRDTLTLLEQALMYSESNKIDSDLIETALGILKDETIDLILERVLSGDSEGLKVAFKKIKDSKIKIDNFVLEFGKRLHQIILSNSALGASAFDLKVNQTSIHLTNSELIWVFDIFTKEGSEALDGIFSTLAVEVLLLKICLRREILRNIGAKPKGLDSKKMHAEIQTVKASDSLAPEKNSESDLGEVVGLSKSDITSTTDEQVGSTVSQDLSWDAFLAYISNKSPATGSNLEQGNIVDRVNLVPGSSLAITLCFSSESEVFYDYLSEKSSREKIISELSNFFNISSNKVNFELRLLEDEEKEKIGFNSIVEIDEKNKEEERDNKRVKLLKSELIVEAQEIFGSQVDKTIIQ